jgi:hypothetical protein
MSSSLYPGKNKERYNFPGFVFYGKLASIVYIYTGIRAWKNSPRLVICLWTRQFEK